jgi:hypothetical protein
MAGSSRLTAAQQADAIARQREGRPDVAAMTSAERLAAGLMTRRQAAQHEHLRSLPVTRLDERVRGPVPDDPWAGPDPDQVRAWRLVFDAGHLDCDGWTADGRDGVVVCACGVRLGEPQAEAS